MKKVLLRVSGMRPEMRRGKVLKPFGTDAAARKIKLAQRAFHPHVHRERAIETVGEQQHAVGNFVPDTAQFHQLLARFRLRQMAQAFRIEFAIGNLPRGSEQMRRAKPHFAGAQFGFGGGGDALWRGERMEQMIFVQSKTAEP